MAILNLITFDESIYDIDGQHKKMHVEYTESKTIWSISPHVEPAYA